MIKRQELFLAQDIRDEYLCYICYQLGLNPMECAKCETLFCNDCALEWAQKNNSCPNKCEGKFELKQAHRMIRSEINKVKCYCKYKSFGCKEELTIENLLSHVTKCEFAPVKCCMQCDWEGQKQDLLSHQDQCQHILDYQCQQCKLKVLKSKKETHNCFESLLRRIQEMEQSFVDYKSQSEIKIQNLEQQIESQSKIIASSIQASSQILQQQQQQISEITNASAQKSIIVEPKEQVPIFKAQQIQQQQKLLQQQQQQQLLQQQQQQQQQLQKGQPKFKTDGKLTDLSKTKQCNQKHPLRFWQTPGIDASKQYCSACSKKQICRYVCENCNEYYCLLCAPPESMTTGRGRICPTGHIMKVRPNIHYVCDVCSKHGETMPQSKTYFCDQCDFDICQQCQELMLKNKDCRIF